MGHCPKRMRQGIAWIMEDELYRAVHATIAKAPEWVRSELASKDATARQRAEDALAAMIANALGHGSGQPPAVA